FAPPIIETLGVAVLAAPVFADHFSIGTLSRFEESRQQFDGGVPAVERFDQRLLERDRAIVAAGIAPRFQEVLFGKVPLASRGRLVMVKAEMNAMGSFREAFGECNVGRRGINGIRIDDEQERYGTGSEFIREIA